MISYKSIKDKKIQKMKGWLFVKNLIIFGAIMVLITVSCSKPNKIINQVEINDGRVRLPRSTPEKEGVPSMAILNFTKNAVDVLSRNQESSEFHSIMIVKNGKVIFERWWEPFAPQYRHELFSLSKSFTSIGTGMAIDEGLLTVDTKLCDIFTDEFEKLGSQIEEKVKNMTIKNLLTMSTGMDREYWSSGIDINNIEAFLTGKVTDNSPGEIFRYSNIATYMLSAAVTRLTGQTLAEYLDPRLFIPLGIVDRHWTIDETTGVNIGASGLSVTTEDLAKFGQLLLQKGMWEGRRLLSEKYIEEATKKQISAITHVKSNH